MQIYLRRIPLIACLIAAMGCYPYIGIPEEVMFVGNGGTELRGTLVFPEDVRRPVPAVVLLHGSEKSTRSFAKRLSANMFVERGFAVLLFDKRGAGESGGDYESTTYAQLIEDALEAVAFVRRRQDVNPHIIGLIGVSQSGWLTPEIAERSGDIAFIINKSGPSLSVVQTIAWERYNDMMADGVSEPSARGQAGVLRQLWAHRISPTIETRIAIVETLAVWAGREESTLPVTLRQVSARYMQMISYDPAPYLDRITVPTLYIYGSEDINVPVKPSVKRIVELAAAGKPITYYVFDGEGHELGGVHLFPPRYSSVEGYAKLVGDFAVKHGQQKSAATGPENGSENLHEF